MAERHNDGLDFETRAVVRAIGQRSAAPSQPLFFPGLPPQLRSLNGWLRLLDAESPVPTAPIYRRR